MTHYGPLREIKRAITIKVFPLKNNDTVPGIISTFVGKYTMCYGNKINCPYKRVTPLVSIILELCNIIFLTY